MDDIIVSLSREDWAVVQEFVSSMMYEEDYDENGNSVDSQLKRILDKLSATQQ